MVALRGLAVGFVVIAVAVSAAGAASTGGTKLWAKRYNGALGGFDQANDLDATADGSKVFVTGESSDSAGIFTTVSYDGAKGAQRWAAHVRVSSSCCDRGRGVAVSPDGKKVFATGLVQRSSTDFGTLAYNAATGKKLWGPRFYDGPAHGLDEPSFKAIAVSPNGQRVFVAGESQGTSTGCDYLTIAYSAASGAPAWTQRYNSSASQCDQPSALTVSPDGSKVFVTGRSDGGDTFEDYVTVAYKTSTGARLWAKRFLGGGDTKAHSEEAYAVAVNPQSTRVAVTGIASDGKTLSNYGTVVYNAATGAQLWVKYYGGGIHHGWGQSVALGSDRVFVTGQSAGSGGDDDYVTIAYKTSTGAVAWLKRYNGPAHGDDEGWAIDLNPARSRVFVTGSSMGGTANQNFGTLEYNASTGAQAWARQYDGPGHDLDFAFAIEARASRVFVAGRSRGQGTDSDYATLAYSAP